MSDTSFKMPRPFNQLAVLFGLLVLVAIFWATSGWQPVTIRRDLNALEERVRALEQKR